MGNVPPEDMIKSLMSVPEVKAVHTLAGDPDVLVELQGRDNGHLQDIRTADVHDSLEHW